MRETPKPVGSAQLLSAQMPACFARACRMRPLDHLFSSFVPEPRCQQALPVVRGCDLFGSAHEPTRWMMVPHGSVRSCCDPLSCSSCTFIYSSLYRFSKSLFSELMSQVASTGKLSLLIRWIIAIVVLFFNCCRCHLLDFE